MNRHGVSLDAEVPEYMESLRPLPSAFRYYDDFKDTYHSVRHPEQLSCWSIESDGQKISFDFNIFDAIPRLFLQHIFMHLLLTLDPTTAVISFRHAKAMNDQFGTIPLLRDAPMQSPSELRHSWLFDALPKLNASHAATLKTFLFSLCELRIGRWSSELADYVTALPLPKKDKYRKVRTGDCFVPLDQQSLVIEYFDELSERLARTPSTISFENLRSACALLIAYQHAFRPGQIARVKTADVRFFNTGAVHFAATLAKKRRYDERRLVTRRIKREWCPLFVEYSHRRARDLKGRPNIPADLYFGWTPAEMSIRIRALIEEITGEHWSATDLRHTAAQRLVDAGSSRIALAEFMGHSNIKTADVYYAASPAQAEIINQNLGLSPIYAPLAEVARTKTIDKAALLRLPDDKQVGAIPHGIPIAGIGGCAVGQSLCSKNPVLSCYTCMKFMPVKDAAIHRQVAADIRPIVLEFAGASRGNTESPSYAQLRRMLTAAEQVAADIEGGWELPNE